MAYIKWTLESLKIEALKYSTRHSFQLENKSAYQSAHRRGWLNEICSHMQITGNLYKRLIYACEFSDNHVYIGLTYNLKNRTYEHTVNNSRNSKSSVLKHSLKTGLSPTIKPLTSYLNIDEAVSQESKFISLYQEQNWILLNKAPAGALGFKNSFWTLDSCKEEASLYKSREEFRKNSPQAYYFAYTRKLLNSICSHMEYLNLPNGYWTFELCLQEAKKFNRRSDFQKESKSAYNASHRNKWLDKICLHMKKRYE